MLLKIGRILGLGIGSWALANVAAAADANVTTNAETMKIGGEFRSELIYDDHGILKTTGQPAPEKTTTLGVTDALITLSGNLNKDTEYAFRFNLLNPNPAGGIAGSPLDYGYATHWFTKMIGFSIGKERVMQGGWDHMDYDYRSHAIGVYNQNLVFTDFDYMLALHARIAGEVTVQFVNDVTANPNPDPSNTLGTLNGDATQRAQFNTHGEHPTFVVGWTGDFGPIKPLLDFGSYDNNKSVWYDIGLKTEMAGLNASLGYWANNQKVRAGAKLADTDTDLRTAINLKIAYEVKNVVTPWIYFSTYDNKQPDDAVNKLSDLKGNTAPDIAMVPGTQVPSGQATYDWSDNGQVWGVGVDMNFFGKNWNPFIAVVGTSGKFLKSAGSTDTETRSDTMVKLGVLGAI